MSVGYFVFWGGGGRGEGGGTSGFHLEALIMT